MTTRKIKKPRSAKVQAIGVTKSPVSRVLRKNTTELLRLSYLLNNALGGEKLSRLMNHWAIRVMCALQPDLDSYEKAIKDHPDQEAFEKIATSEAGVVGAEKEFPGFAKLRKDLLAVEVEVAVPLCRNQWSADSEPCAFISDALIKFDLLSEEDD